MNITAQIMVVVHAFIAWIIVLGGLTAINKLPRPTFIVLHYIFDIVIFGLVFWFFYKNFKAAPFQTMAITMVSLFVFEFIFWKFFYTGTQNYLTFLDWVVPAFIVASTVYLIGAWLK